MLHSTQKVANLRNYSESHFLIHIRSLQDFFFNFFKSMGYEVEIVYLTWQIAMELMIIQQI